jgi:hypothetical protein
MTSDSKTLIFVFAEAFTATGLTYALVAILLRGKVLTCSGKCASNKFSCLRLPLPSIFVITIVYYCRLRYGPNGVNAACD